MRVLAGGPARETGSPMYRLHREGLEAQGSADVELKVRHEVCRDPRGPRWDTDKIERVARVRQGFLDEVRDNDVTYDALLMVDTDVVIGPGVLERMLAVEADVVYGVFWTESDWGGPVAPYPQVWDINPYGWSPACAEALNADGSNEVEVLGGGACTLLRGRAFESRYHPLLGSVRAYSNMWAGEDRTYCLGLECRGIKQVAVTGLPITHCYYPEQQTLRALEDVRRLVGL